ncbi:MAG TPA: hypothetical protein DEA59_06370, partial [Microbacterium sp.]|nr:hypothetical protein [Microbacterium sp.]
YAVYHGPEGLRAIARSVHGQATLVADALTARGLPVLAESFFDTIQVRVANADAVIDAAR